MINGLTAMTALALARPITVISVKKQMVAANTKADRMIFSHRPWQDRRHARADPGSGDSIAHWGERAMPTPIMESRVTSLASSPLDMPSVPSGRAGKTM